MSKSQLDQYVNMYVIRFFFSFHFIFAKVSFDNLSRVAVAEGTKVLLFSRTVFTGRSSGLNPFSTKIRYLQNKQMARSRFPNSGETS